jgi:hypothetical protein
MARHTKKHGSRAHHLTNLGGLIALAGLDLEPPDLLLSALFQMPRGSRIVAASDVRHSRLWATKRSTNAPRQTRAEV